MGLETGNYVGDLNTANPAATDVKSQGDDHLRLIKAALKQTFGGFAGAVIVRGTDGGSANTFTVTPATALPTYVQGMIVEFEPTASNTGASTINISGLGAKDLKSVAGAALASGELVAGSVYLAAYDGTEFRLLGPTKAYIDQLAFSTALPIQSGNADKYVSTDGTNAEWRTFSASAAQVRGGTATDVALTPGSTYAGLDEVPVTSSAGSVSLDFGAGGGNNFYHEMTENTTFGNPSNAKVGQSGYILVKQHSSSAKTAAFASNWRRVGGPVAISTTLGGYTVVEYQVNSVFVLYEILNNPAAA